MKLFFFSRNVRENRSFNDVSVCYLRFQTLVCVRFRFGSTMKNRYAKQYYYYFFITDIPRRVAVPMYGILPGHVIGVCERYNSFNWIVLHWSASWLASGTQNTEMNLSQSNVLIEIFFELDKKKKKKKNVCFIASWPSIEELVEKKKCRNFDEITNLFVTNFGVRWQTIVGSAENEINWIYSNTVKQMRSAPCFQVRGTLSLSCCSG